MLVDIDKLSNYYNKVKPSRLVQRVFLARKKGNPGFQYYASFKYSAFQEDLFKFIHSLTKRQKARLMQDISDFKR